MGKKKAEVKTYSSGDSLVVIYLTTNPPVSCLNRVERSGSLVVSCPEDVQTLQFAVYGVLHTVITRLSVNGKRTAAQSQPTGDQLAGARSLQNIIPFAVCCLL